jgi:hypothetical protein
VFPSWDDLSRHLLSPMSGDGAWGSVQSLLCRPTRFLGS